MPRNAFWAETLGGQTGLGTARGRVQARGGSSHNRDVQMGQRESLHWQSTKFSYFVQAILGVYQQGYDPWGVQVQVGLQIYHWPFSAGGLTIW